MKNIDTAQACGRDGGGLEHQSCRYSAFPTITKARRSRCRHSERNARGWKSGRSPVSACPFGFLSGGVLYHVWTLRRVGQDDCAISLGPRDPKGSAREGPAVAKISMRPPTNVRYNAKLMIPIPVNTGKNKDRL